MELIPFNAEKEMVPLYERPGRHGAPGRTVWTAPISAPDNIRHAMTDKQIMYLPNLGEMKMMHTRLIPDNCARASVRDGLGPFTPPAEGMKDAFGVTWVFEPEVGGAMEKPGEPHLLEDINDWEDVIKFPNPDEWAWDEQAELNKEYLSDPAFLNKSAIFTGYFERLISWLGFEDAIVSLYDEDYTDAVEAVFTKLTDYYINVIGHIKEAFDVELIEFHDDWGSQKAPLFSPSVVEEMIMPHMQRVIDFVHEKGMFFELHSCGNIEVMVPLMIEMGVDTWMGQECNDKKMLFDKYGDKLMIQVEVPELGVDASDEEIWAAAQKFCDDFCVQGKPVAMGLYANSKKNKPLMHEAIYVISRKMLCGEEA